MHRPQRRDEERGPRLANQPDRQRVNEQHVARVQQEVDRVIAEGLFAVAQHRVIEEVGQSGEGSIEAALAVWPPVGVAEDQAEIRGGQFADARVVQQQPSVVQHKAAVERVAISQQRKRDQGKCGRNFCFAARLPPGFRLARSVCAVCIFRGVAGLPVSAERVWLRCFRKRRTPALLCLHGNVRVSEAAFQGSNCKEG